MPGTSAKTTRRSIRLPNEFEYTLKIRADNCGCSPGEYLKAYLLSTSLARVSMRAAWVRKRGDTRVCLWCGRLFNDGQRARKWCNKSCQDAAAKSRREYLKKFASFSKH